MTKTVFLLSHSLFNKALPLLIYIFIKKNNYMLYSHRETVFVKTLKTVNLGNIKLGSNKFKTSAQ